MAYISCIVPNRPSLESTAPGRPVYGRQAMTFADAINGLNGYKFLRTWTMPVELAAFDDDDAQSPRGILTTYRALWYPGPVATHIWIGMWEISEPGYKVAPPSISATLYDVGTGVASSHTITWDTLTSPGMITLGSGQFGATEGDDQFLHTGWSESVPTNTQPGLLEIGAQTGKETELRIVTTALVRIYSITVVEVYRSEIA